MKLVTIESDTLRAQVQICGGALYTITDKVKNKQLMWEGEQGLWSDRDHVMFPFVCRRVDGKYLDGGVEYEMPLHGFVRDMDFTVTQKSENAVKLTVSFNENTLKMYPHEFELSVLYTIVCDELTIEYEIKNLDGKQMYFSFGGHLGLKATTDGNGDTKGNYITFNPPLDTIYNLEKGAYTYAPEKCEPFGKCEVDKAFFQKYGTLILGTKDGLTATYETAQNDKILFTLPSPIIALWADDNKGGFCCVEPWWGLPDSLPLKREISQKVLMFKVDGNGSYKSGYKLQIIR